MPAIIYRKNETDPVSVCNLKDADQIVKNLNKSYSGDVDTPEVVNLKEQLKNIENALKSLRDKRFDVKNVKDLLSLPGETLAIVKNVGKLANQEIDRQIDVKLRNKYTVENQIKEIKKGLKSPYYYVRVPLTKKETCGV